MGFSTKMYTYYAFRALCVHLLFQLWTCSLYIHYKTKQKKVADFIKNVEDFQKFQKSELQLKINELYIHIWSYEDHINDWSILGHTLRTKRSINQHVLSFFQNRWREDQFAIMALKTICGSISDRALKIDLR